MKLAKSIITSIIPCYNTQPKDQHRPKMWGNWAHQLDFQAKGLIISSIEHNCYNNLKVLDTPSKSGQNFLQATQLKYLKIDWYFKIKSQKKLSLSSKNKKAKLRLAKENLGWTIKDWYHII